MQTSYCACAINREEELTVALNVSENVGTPSADRAYIHTSRIATLFMTFCEESALFSMNRGGLNCGWLLITFQSTQSRSSIWEKGHHKF